MISPAHEYQTDLAGRPLIIRVGQLAQQTNASCVVQYGDTVVLCTATMGEAREDAGFFPLSVDFEERMYAAGRIKGSRFIKREGRPTDEAILSGRLVDRAVRPLFPSTLRNEIAVVATVFSHDQENDADIPALIGASCALALSDIPWAGPIASVRVGRVNGAHVLMPTYQQTEQGDLDLVVAGTAEKTIMVEAGAKQIPEAEMLAALRFASESLRPVIELIQQVVAKHGKTKLVKPPAELDTAKAEGLQRVKQVVETFFAEHGHELFAEPLRTKADRKRALKAFAERVIAYATEQGIGKDWKNTLWQRIEDAAEAAVTHMILDKQHRPDGRGIHEIRPLGAMVAVLPRTHGSGLFQRGSTQVLSAVTLGSPGMEQTLDTMEFQMTKRYFHHYNFPSYAVSETKPNRGPGRREIGHGALAERAIMPVLPQRDAFPYTMRVVSEVLESNGSSSMGATCGSTLALMDAGVPISAPVAGIAMGLASDESTNRYQVITDLQDMEDGAGGMDFKIAGSKDGITAMQMDTKTTGLPWSVVEETLARARDARLNVLNAMLEVIPAPRAELSKYAPRIITFMINPEKIRDVIGPGGKVINEIIAKHKVEIDIEDSGQVTVTSVNPESLQAAIDWIKQLTREVKAGETFEGRVTRILDFGAFVEILPKVEGLVHISEMAPYRVGKVGDIVKIGQMVHVIVYEIDDMGRLNLSMKRTEGNVYPPAPEGMSGPRGPRPDGPRPPRPEGDRPTFRPRTDAQPPKQSDAPRIPRVIS